MRSFSHIIHKNHNVHFVAKDWGYEQWLANNHIEKYCAKILTILPDHHTSWHYHEKKHETFYILEGQIDFVYETTDEAHDSFTKHKFQITLKEGESAEIPRKVVHQIQNNSGKIAKIIEASTEHYDIDSIRLSLDAKWGEEA